MKIFFDTNSGVPKLTTMECRNMLEEERHHTDFLDGIKEKITSFCLDKITFMVTQNQYHYSFVFKEENEYFDNLLITIDLSKKPDYYNRKYTDGSFYNQGALLNNKLHYPQLDMEIAIGMNNEVDKRWVSLIIDHEINHLYDDWQWQITGHQPLTNNAEWNHGDGLFIQENLQNLNNPLVEAIAWCVYASLWTETNAYTNQAYREFEYIGLNTSNVHKKLKTTVSYANYSGQAANLKKVLQSLTDEEVKKEVLGLFKKYGRISVPKPKDGIYKEKLLKWSESIFAKFMKRYCGIASLYLERMAKQKFL